LTKSDKLLLFQNSYRISIRLQYFQRTGTALAAFEKVKEWRAHERQRLTEEIEKL
jgi:hypothetical protein